MDANVIGFCDGVMDTGTDVTEESDRCFFFRVGLKLNVLRRDSLLASRELSRDRPRRDVDGFSRLEPPSSLEDLDCDG